MPVEILKKPVTKPQCASRHAPMVPLRIVEIRKDSNDARDETLRELAAVGDICVKMSEHWPHIVFNATKGCVIDSQSNEYVLYVREYSVAQIVITNDSSPAPVL